MPIKIRSDSSLNKAELVIGRDVEICLCSSDCLLKELDDQARVVRTGQTDATALTAILGNDRLLVPLAGARRADAHVLGAQNGRNSARENWEKLLGHRSSSLMRVYKVCDCLAEVQILDGESFEDAATTPAWKKVRRILSRPTTPGREDPLTLFDQWRNAMADLAHGLDELEKMGLAHGDPYPFNAIYSGPGATWVDFGHLTDDPAQQAKDAWAFILFTVLHSLGKCKTYSPTLLEGLAGSLTTAEQPGRFSAIRRVLGSSYSDVIGMDDARTPSLVFAESVVEQFRTTSQRPELLVLLLKSSAQYFSDFLHNIKRANQYIAGFHFERQRHYFAEKELQRLSLPIAEYNRKIEALQLSHQEAVVHREQQIANLNQVVVERDAQIVNWTDVLAERDLQIEQLQCVAVAHADELTHLGAEVQARDAEIARLTSMLHDREDQLARLSSDDAVSGLEGNCLDQAIDNNEDLRGADGAVPQLRAEIVRLNEIGAQLNLDISSALQALSERDAQLAHVQSEARSLFGRLEQVLQSRSWRVTRPLRAAARILKHGHPFADGGRRFYGVAAQVGRKLPIPIWLKARARAELIKRIYPAASVPIVVGEEEGRFSLQRDQPLSAPSLPPRAACCGLVEGLVSVVLPVYNQADLIVESIESVLSQTYQNFELIIVNDGSTDGVEAVLEPYLSHPRVHCFTQANQRLPKALSNGFSFASGEFWTWTSADNIMEPRMLEALVAKLRADPSVGMTFCDYYAIDDRGDILSDLTWRAHNRPEPGSGEIRLPHTTEALNSVQDNFIGPCFMYRGWVGRCLGDYDPQLGVEDYDYWMRINAFFPIRHLGDGSLLYRYRVHDNTLSAQAHSHKILEKAQRLMAYERERADHYARALVYAVDARGLEWLRANGFSDGDTCSLSLNTAPDVPCVIDGASVLENLDHLLASRRPVAVLLGRHHIAYHKLIRLLMSGHCIVLAQDKESAARVRMMLNSCPIIDANSTAAPAVITAFLKNLSFIRMTRRPEELERTLPERIGAPRRHHIVLQVDSFTQGGMENVVIDLALSLEKNGFRMTIVNFGKSGDAAAKAQEAGLSVVELATDTSDDVYCAWLSENNVDLVNAHYSIRGAGRCRNAGIPFVQTVHNSYVWLDPVQIEKHREADRYTSCYICVSMTAARYADVALGLDVSKMRVVSNGIDSKAINAADFSRNRHSMRARLGFSEESPVFLNVASVMATKAQVPLIRAFSLVVKQIPQARLVLLGSVMEPAYQAASEKAVEELGLRGCVSFAGYDREVAPYYHAADVFVLPSYWEGWSLSLGEAMANGLACVITDVGSASDFEGMDNVQVVAPPFGDIAALNYRNLGDFVYGRDVAFEGRVAEAMVKMAGRRRTGVNPELAARLDRELAYQTYAEIFSDIVKQRS